MKRNKLVLAVLLSLAATLAYAADTYTLPAFAPVGPEVKAQGGAFTAVSNGFNGLFFNPAGFATNQNSLTILGVNPTANVALSRINDVIVFSQTADWANPDIGAIADALTDIITLEGIGFQANAGLGWVGSGLGLGIAAQTSVYARGTTVLGTKIAADLIEGAVIGYALPIDLAFSTVKVGLDIRPMQRTYGEFDLSSATAAMKDLTALTMANGFGLGFDLGVIADFGPFDVGISVRDLGGTHYAMKTYSVADIATAATFTAGAGTDTLYDYVTPMTINTGFAYTPAFGLLGVLIQPRFTGDLNIPMVPVAEMPSLLASSHLGVEVKLLSFLTLRGGLNQGWVTAGLGAHLLFLDANIAIYSDELGRYTGTARKPGVAAEVALRF